VVVELKRRNARMIFLELLVSISLALNISLFKRGYMLMWVFDIDPLVDLGKNVEGGVEGFFDFLGAPSDDE
jgi:hypothetical protein